MLDDDLHTSLPEADVTAFFQARLRSYMRSLKTKRIVELVDGSMTTAKARRNNLEAFVLHGLSEHGLRKEIPQAQLANLAPVLRNEAADIQRKKYKEFMSAELNDGVKQWAETQFGDLLSTEYDKLFLRKAATDARMAPHSALEAVPVHAVDTARAAALELLKLLIAAAPAGSPPAAQQAEIQFSAPHVAPSVPALLSHGVEMTTGRITAETTYRHRDQAIDQPEEQSFHGLAGNAVTERAFGADLMGTAARMARKSRAQDDTNQQKLKSAGLFIYVTGIQMVTDMPNPDVGVFHPADAGAVTA